MSIDDQELISRLKFIANIGKGEKINVPKLLVLENTWQTTISRTVWNIDTRQNAQNFIKDTINTSFENIYLFIKSGNISKHHIAKNMIIDIIKAKKGISNIKYTYRTDIMFKCAMDTLIQRIDAKLTELKNNYQGLMDEINITDDDDDI